MTNDLKPFSSYADLNVETDSVLPLSHHSWWITLKPSQPSEAGALEGKLHLPAEKATRLIIFQPGFPGGASTDFERLHVKTLLASGYAVFAGRHRGTILNGKHSDYYINCAERQQKALADKQYILGNKACALHDWLDEPILALDSLGGAFEEIVLIGHSFGGLAVMLSSTKIFRHKLKHYAKIKKIISLAGVGGRLRNSDDQTLLRWSEFIKSDWGATDRIETIDEYKNIEGISKAHVEVHKFADSIPASVAVICLSAHGDEKDAVDELIPVQEALDMIVSIGHGTLIIDKTQKPDPDSGKLAHELENLKSTDLLRLIDLSWKPDRQILKLDAHGIN
jgi:pimeloyl-ACP methyl ester carboxylesterase